MYARTISTIAKKTILNHELRGSMFVLLSDVGGGLRGAVGEGAEVCVIE